MKEDDLHCDLSLNALSPQRLPEVEIEVLLFYSHKTLFFSFEILTYINILWHFCGLLTSVNFCDTSY